MKRFSAAPQSQKRLSVQSASSECQIQDFELDDRPSRRSRPTPPRLAWSHAELDERRRAALDEARFCYRCSDAQRSRHPPAQLAERLSYTSRPHSMGLKRNILLGWARCRAQKESFAELCAGPGWKASTAYLIRDRAAREIADGINSAIQKSE